MNLYTIVTNDEYEFPVKCDMRPGEAARFLGITTDRLHSIVHRPLKKSRYRVIVSGRVVFDKRAYDKRYGMIHDRSRYLSERGKRIRRERKMMEELYRQNQDFREYVDKYCRDYGHTVEEALGHTLVREVAGYYRQKEQGKQGKEEGITENAGKVFTGDPGNGLPV